MKRYVWLVIFACTIENQIEMIRPGASYVIHSGDYAGIEWLDKGQTQPTPLEMDQALATCTAGKQAGFDATATAKQVLKNPTATDKEKLDALIKIIAP